jgi:hypothetical protein
MHGGQADRMATEVLHLRGYYAVTATDNLCCLIVLNERVTGTTDTVIPNGKTQGVTSGL